MLYVLVILGIVLLLAYLVETVTEFVFGVLAGWLCAIWPAMQSQLEPFKRPFVQTITIFLGIYGAFLLQFDVLHLASVAYMEGLPEGAANRILPITAYGMTLTGIAIGMGSTYIHQFISKFFPPKQAAG
jgi:hypothetical protein